MRRGALQPQRGALIGVAMLRQYLLQSCSRGVWIFFFAWNVSPKFDICEKFTFASSCSRIRPASRPSVTTPLSVPHAATRCSQSDDVPGVDDGRLRSCSSFRRVDDSGASRRHAKRSSGAQSRHAEHQTVASACILYACMHIQRAYLSGCWSVCWSACLYFGRSACILACGCRCLLR